MPPIAPTESRPLVRIPFSAPPYRHFDLDNVTVYFLKDIIACKKKHLTNDQVQTTLVTTDRTTFIASNMIAAPISSMTGPPSISRERAHPSLLLEVLELGLRLLLAGGDVALVINIDHTCFLHLREHLPMLLQLLVQLIVAAELVLDHLDLVELGLDVGFTISL